MWLSRFESRRARLAETFSYRVYLVRQALRTAVSIPAEMGKNTVSEVEYVLVWREPHHLAYMCLDQGVYLCLRPSRDSVVSA